MVGMIYYKGCGLPALYAVRDVFFINGRLQLDHLSVSLLLPTKRVDDLVERHGAINL